MPGPFYMAWAGGAIEPQITLATNGNTHGGGLESVPLVGDIATASQQLTNMSSSAGLEEGALYHIVGTGLDAYFLFDNSILAGVPGSLNLNTAATGTAQSGQFQATKSIPVGTVLATLTQGSNAVALDAGDLAAGTYGIAGTGIGETDVPIGTTEGSTVTSGGGILIIGSAYVDYAGGSGSMYILAATPYTTTGDDQFGQPINITTYLVLPQPVRATTSGQFPVLLTGFPTDDPFAVTGVPSGALLSLTPGLVYNITGNGIPVGASFIAPMSGTTLTLDLAATASDINAILTITGPRTPNAPFDASVHNRMDEDVIGLDISQEEGGLATLTIDIKNPGVGLLATGRNLWCWLSWDQAWLPDGTGTPDLVPLFNGRLIGVPRLAAGEIVQLQFLARPDDFNAQKSALASALSVLPYYDPIWLASNVNLDSVLESYSALWHIDRTSLLLTTSDVLEGEDGIIEVGEDLAIYDHFTLGYGQPPLIATTVSGTVSWAQQAEGMIDVTQNIVGAFYGAGSGYSRAFATNRWGGGGGGLIQVMCGDGLRSDWPKPGTGIGGGWSLSTQNDGAGEPLCYIILASDPTSGGWIEGINYTITYEGAVPDPMLLAQENFNFPFMPIATLQAAFPVMVYKIRMHLDYKANRKRTETVVAVMLAGVQRELSDSAESDQEGISLTSEFVDKGIDPGGAVPIGNLAYRSYFQTARGAASFEYLLLTARAKIRARARAVDVTFAVPWRDALAITLRHNVRLTDRRLPGGVALGKVKSSKLSCTGGVMLGEFTMGCAIGSGEATAPQAGIPVYVDAGYVNDYQISAGAQITLGAAGDLAYETLDDFVVVDDGLDLTHLTAAEAVNECVVINGMTDQASELAQHQGSTVPANGNPIQTMQTMATAVTLDLKPVQGSEFHTAFYPAVTPLVLPKMIDLSAPAPGA